MLTLLINCIEFSVLLRVLVRNGFLLSNSCTKIIQPRPNAKFCTSQDAGSQTASSKEFADDEEKEESMKIKIFEAAMPFVPELGWSKECLEAGIFKKINYIKITNIVVLPSGAESMGYPTISQGVFEHGSISFVQLFHKTCNKKLKAEINLEETKRFVHFIMIHNINFIPVINYFLFKF